MRGADHLIANPRLSGSPFGARTHNRERGMTSPVSATRYSSSVARAALTSSSQSSRLLPQCRAAISSVSFNDDGVPTTPSREAGPGERLPPARDLAAVLGVNANTVLRALRILRDEGLLEFRRGRGITVSGTPEQGAVVAKARELVSFARQFGYRPDELARIIRTLP